MATSNPVAWIVAGLSALGLGGALYAVQLVSRRDLSGWLAVTTYGACALIILSCGLFLFAMLAGMQTDWSNPAKTAMMLGALLTVPACVGLLVLIAAGAMGTGDGARSYLIGFGIAGLALLAIPALILVVMALPGKP